MKAKEYLNQLLAEDRLQEVLEAFKAQAASLDEELEAEIILLSGKFAHIEKQKRLGTVNQAEANLERNRIRVALQAIADEIPDELEINPGLLKKQQQKKYIAFGVIGGFTVFVIALFIFALQPKQDIRIEAQLLLEQVSFRHLKGSYGFSGKSLSALHIYNYAQLEIQGDKFELTENLGNFSKNQRYNLTAPMLIEPYPEVAGVGVNLGQLRLEELSIPSGALLTFIRPKSTLDPFQIQTQFGEPISGYMSYNDSLDITIEQAMANIEEQNIDVLELLLFYLLTEKGRAGEIRFESFPGNLSMDMFLDDSLVLRAIGLRISEISFYKPVEQIAVPSILGGELKLQESHASPMKIIPLQSGESLNLIGAASLSLNELTINQEGISLSFNGKVQKIETGQNEENQNPSLFAWVFHNYPFRVIGGMIVILFLAGVMLKMFHTTIGS